MQHDTRGGGEPWSHARRPSPVESGNRGNAELGACGVRGCTGVGVKKVARDVRFDVMAGRTRCLNVTRYNRARHTKGSFCSFPPRHTKRRRRSAGEGGRVARETHRGRPVRSPTTLLATLSPAGEEKGAMMLGGPGRLHCLSGPGPSASTRAATPPPPPPAILRPPRKRRHSQMGSDRPGQP